MSQETTTEYILSRARYHVTGDNHWVHFATGEMSRHRRQPLSTYYHGLDTTSQETTTDYTSSRVRRRHRRQPLSTPCHGRDTTLTRQLLSIPSHGRYCMSQEKTTNTPRHGWRLHVKAVVVTAQVDINTTTIQSWLQRVPYIKSNINKISFYFHTKLKHDLHY